MRLTFGNPQRFKGHVAGQSGASSMLFAGSGPHFDTLEIKGLLPV
jgi:hypothetical protein